MRKRMFLAVIVPLISLVVVGCGVPLEEYDAVLAERDAAQAQLTSLQSELARVQSDLAAAQAQIESQEPEEEKLTDSEGIISSLEADLQIANDEIQKLLGDLETQQNLNLALSEELKGVEYPRHFESFEELSDWLQKDDTDTKYTDEHWANLSYILQIKALRDGYLLPATPYILNDVLYIANSAYIGGSIWYVVAESDDVRWRSRLEPPTLPSHPIRPD